MGPVVARASSMKIVRDTRTACQRLSRTLSSHHYCRFFGRNAPRDDGEIPSRQLAAGLLGSFGGVDLLCRPSGEWLVLEVGTDGMFNHIDRDLGLPALESEIQQRVADPFGSRVGGRP
jgi:hypothetical protein